MTDGREATERRPNVVWLTLDSVRADHTTMNGYRRDTTPTLARMAADPAGRNFPSCYAHGRYTLVSSASILTGTYPSRHRVGYEEQALGPALPTIAERFRDAGYHTACLSSNSFVSGATGLDRGFEQFAHLEPRSLLRTAGPLTVLKFLLGIRRHSAGFERDLRKHCTARLTTDVAKSWLASFRGSAEPFFSYIHVNEPHRPYYPPRSHQALFAEEVGLDGYEAAEISMDLHGEMMKRVARGCDLSEREWDALLASYDAEIRYTDECIGELVRVIRRELGSTIVVVTADHGEFFGERGMLSHKYVLHDALLNVPLVTYGLDGVDGDGLVQHVDVLRTLLEIADADAAGVQGIDLREETREFVISQDHGLTMEPILEHDPSFDVSGFYPVERSVIRNETFKLRRTVDGETQLLRPPDEETDLSADHPDVAAALDERLVEWLRTEGTAAGEGARAEFTDEMRRHLANMGYLEEEIS